MYIHTILVLIAAASAFLLRRRPVLMVAAIVGFFAFRNQLAALLYRVVWPGRK